MKPWAQYVIAFMIFCHGFVYVRIGSMLPAPVKGWKGSSWLFGDGIGNLQLILCCREGGRVDTKHDSRGGNYKETRIRTARYLAAKGNSSNMCGEAALAGMTFFRDTPQG